MNKEYAQIKSTTEPKSSRFSSVEKWARERTQYDTYKKIFGIDVDIKPFPDKITPPIEQKLKNYGFQVVYIGGIDLGTPESLQKKGAEAYLNDISLKYPKLKQVEKLSSEESRNSKIPRLLELNYWYDVYDKHTEFPVPLNNWVAVESHNTSEIRKGFIGNNQDKLLEKLGLSSRENNSWKDLYDPIYKEGHKFISKDIGLPGMDEELGFLSLVDSNILGNLAQIYQESNKLELTGTEYKDVDGLSIYATGYASGGGAGIATKVEPDYVAPTLAFRTAIFLERPSFAVNEAKRCFSVHHIK